uniref:CUB domain-containing protein n=1 Tax=Parastrongyloides trichosuri TaxID=131310 RepID=A0A0N4ZVT9_PARTI
MLLKLVLTLLTSSIFITNIQSQKCHCDDRRIVLFRATDNRLIFTPEYPRYYCGNLDCLWIIESFKNHSQFHFFANNIDLRDGKDYLYFYEGHKKRDIRKNHELIPSHSCTGKGLCQYYSSGEKLIIRFKSSTGYPSHYGFQGRISIYQPGIINFINDSILLIIAFALALLIFIVIILTILFFTKKSTPMKKKTKVEEKLLEENEKKTEDVN